MWGDTVSISDRVRHCQLEWLGHVARMEDARLPRRLLFSSLPLPRPACGPRLRWKHVVSRHLVACGCRDWFGLSTDRNRWRREVVSYIPDAEPQIEPVMCPICHRSFRRPDMKSLKRRKCTAIRLLPLHLQPGAAPCPACHRWFASRGGLAVHRCQIQDSQPPTTPAKRPPLTKRPSVSARAAFAQQCARCERRFSRLQDVKRHSPFCS